VGSTDAAVLPAGADSHTVARALLSAIGGLQLTGVEQSRALGREVTQGIVRGGFRAQQP